MPVQHHCMRVRVCTTTTPLPLAVGLLQSAHTALAWQRTCDNTACARVHAECSSAQQARAALVQRHCMCVRVCNAAAACCCLLQSACTASAWQRMRTHNVLVRADCSSVQVRRLPCRLQPVHKGGAVFLLQRVLTYSWGERAAQAAVAAAYMCVCVWGGGGGAAVSPGGAAVSPWVQL